MGQILAAHYFGSFREVSPPVLVHSLSHLKCAMVGGGMQKPKDGVCQEASKRQAAALGSPQPWPFIDFYSHRLPSRFPGCGSGLLPRGKDIGMAKI